MRVRSRALASGPAVVCTARFRGFHGFSGARALARCLQYPKRTLRERTGWAFDPAGQSLTTVCLEETMLRTTRTLLLARFALLTTACGGAPTHFHLSLTKMRWSSITRLHWRVQLPARTWNCRFSIAARAPLRRSMFQPTVLLRR